MDTLKEDFGIGGVEEERVGDIDDNDFVVWTVVVDHGFLVDEGGG